MYVLPSETSPSKGNFHLRRTPQNVPKMTDDRDIQ